MHHSRRNDHRLGLLCSRFKNHCVPERRRVIAIVPEVYTKRRGADEAELVGLFTMFVRSTGDSRLRRRYVSHDRQEFLRRLIRPKQFSQPPPVIRVPGKVPYDDTSYLSASKRHNPPLEICSIYKRMREHERQNNAVARQLSNRIIVVERNEAIGSECSNKRKGVRGLSVLFLMQMKSNKK
jgi:hypothetical protein